MEGMPMLLSLLQIDDWMCTIDLKDAYFGVAIAPVHRKYLRFVWNKKLFQFKAMPFGLSSAPKVYTKLLKQW